MISRKNEILFFSEISQTQKSAFLLAREKNFITFRIDITLIFYKVYKQFLSSLITLKNYKSFLYLKIK